MCAPSPAKWEEVGVRREDPQSDGSRGKKRGRNPKNVKARLQIIFLPRLTKEPCIPVRQGTYLVCVRLGRSREKGIQNREGREGVGAKVRKKRDPMMLSLSLSLLPSISKSDLGWR